MAFDSQTDILRPATGEAPFGIAEVFYSRTDTRGVIRAGNEVFRRVSDYPWDRLIGAPHRLIRHPEMPRGVFRLMWDRIQDGRPTGAYVRNLAQDGLHYWVFAVVTPIQGGYLSVRIRPSSATFAAVRGEYAALLAREAEGLDPAASAAALLERIGHLGHADYDDFMAAALAAELTAPARAEVVPPSEDVGRVAGIVSRLRDVLAEKQRLLRSFDEIRAIPMNLHITASRIEAYGGPVATLAENYRLMATDITRRLEWVVGDGKAAGAGERMLAAVTAALFRLGSAQVQAETVEQCRHPQDSGAPVDRAAEIAILEDVARRFARQAAEGLAEVGRISAELVGTCEELKRHMLGLDSIRILCRVEAGRLQLKGAGLTSIIGHLDHFHAEIEQRLDRIVELAAAIRAEAEAVPRRGDA